MKGRGTLGWLIRCTLNYLRYMWPSDDQEEGVEEEEEALPNYTYNMYIYIHVHL